MKLTNWRDRRLFITRTNNEGNDELLSIKTLWLRARANDQIAWTRLWQECERHALPTVINKYRFLRADQPEILSACSLGFINAIRDWKQHKSPLFAFCNQCMTKVILLSIRRKYRLKRTADRTALSLDAKRGANKQYSLHNLIINPTNSFNFLYEKENVEEIINLLSPLLSPLEQIVFADFMRSPGRYKKRYDRLGISQRSFDNATQRIRTRRRDQLLQAYRAYQIL